MYKKFVFQSISVLISIVSSEYPILFKKLQTTFFYYYFIKNKLLKISNDTLKYSSTNEVLLMILSISLFMQFFQLFLFIIYLFRDTLLQQIEVEKLL